MSRSKPMCRLPVLPLVLSAASACGGTIDPGPRVELILSETSVAAPGEELLIVEAWLTTWSVTLEVCSSASTKHGLDAPNRASAVVVENVADSASFGFVEELAPVPGYYCGVTVEALPADDDAVGESPELQRGLSMRLAGVHAGSPFTGETAATFSHRIEFDEPLVLQPGDRWQLRIERDPSSWLQSADFDWADDDSVGRAALRDALLTASVTVEPL